MTAITYTAKDRTVGGRSALVDGHTAGTDYTLDTDAHTLDPWEDEEAPRQVALDGTTEGLLHRIDEGFDVLTDHIAIADQPAWREFFASVRAAEGFTFDAYGTSASPDNPRPAILEGTPRPMRVASTRTLQYRFRVRFTG